MNLEAFNEARCVRAEKEVVEGICLSFDLLRQICLETGQRCVALESQPVPGASSELFQ